jgi:hypothetical protein
VEKNTKKDMQKTKGKDKERKGNFGKHSIRLGAFEGGNFKRKERGYCYPLT